MADEIKNKENSRRTFFTSLFNQQKKEMVKMLTADGKLVEVEKSVLAAASKKQKSSNSDIYQWMENPSKDK